ncbi:P-loop containing nucleoside triphosphate hydrolase protein [Glomus cerebriforme]|uniref:P-loop containing nucleoside triphosphate hydrolase protein n=1 Tax=Glomus cerebriforme TaxID=658196 RepID=A0A397THN1_9GLOM|nr:P-loop containing nucleoside triphosphate hydrolase protein [Glomus cerebriforme]
MDLIELLKDSNNDEQKCDDLLKRCFNSSESDLDEFINNLSRSFDIHLPTLQNFISHLCNKYLQVTPNANLRWNIFLAKFMSSLITIVIMDNLHNSDLFDFCEFLHKSIELLWWASNKKNNNNKLNLAFQTINLMFSKIMDADGVLEVLVSEVYGRRCLKRILFDFNMINQIERIELLKAVDIVAALVEKCPEHKNDLSLSEGFYVYKACTALLETLGNHQGVQADFHKNLKSLSIKDDLTLLRMKLPQKLSDLPHFLLTLEQRKIDSFSDLMGFLPCTNCHKQALNYMYPKKYFLEEESATLECFRLPFEFNDDDKLGPWDILLSEDTIKDLQQLESTPEVIRAVMKKLGHISSGEWDKYKLRCTVRTDNIPVYEVAFLDNNLKILWQIDYGFSIRNNSYMQLVKIWAVTANKERIDKILKNLSIAHISKQSNWCVAGQMGKNNTILPMILGDEEPIKPSEDRFYSLYNSKTDDELLEVHKMLVINKFIPLSTNLYKSLVLGGFNFTFQVSKKEHEIINCPTSAIIIGRSGTGKTTCIVFRQIASYLNSRLNKIPSDDKIFHRRQIFITMSPNLRHRVKEYFDNIRESAILAGTKMSKAQFREYRRKKEEENANDQYMHEEENEKRELKGIPDSFNHLQLTDKYFPLFITFEKFSKMLQETYGISNRDIIKQKKYDADNIDSYDKEKYEPNISPSFINTEDKNFVNYTRFRKKYWPSLNDHCSQNFDCGLVYSEFSIIKGSNPEVDYLSREDYRTVSIKKFPVFCYNRDQIYDLFLLYEKMKARNGDYDSMDRTLAILHCAKKKTLGGLHIHEVYIDECQDNHIVDIALILKVFDRASSIFLAGDIAQCIARGSSFRFQDLRALMYQWELTRAPANHRSVLKPKQFELNVNYRSHNGILQLAASVVDLIRKFFPNSIDHLLPERSEVGGPRPIIFDGFQDFVDSKKNGQNERQKRSSFIEFGAEQVILVREEDQKKSIKSGLGLVMTVFEAKGMEFDDVLLYNFFTDSLACQKWRVILSALNENSEGVPAFSHEKHYILSSELKHLYVAITRARQHIWICEENTEYIMPIRMYWEHLGLIEVSHETTLSSLAKKSDSHEWNRQGRKFFEQRQYEQVKSLGMNI